MNIVKFKKQFLLEVLSDGIEGAHILKDEIEETSRWSVHYHLVFEYKDKFYSVGYRVGATESQDEGPWQYDGDEIDCTEVKPVEEKIIVYKPV